MEVGQPRARHRYVLVNAASVLFVRPRQPGNSARSPRIGGFSLETSPRRVAFQAGMPFHHAPPSVALNSARPQRSLRLRVEVASLKMQPNPESHEHFRMFAPIFNHLQTSTPESPKSPPMLRVGQASACQSERNSVPEPPMSTLR